MKSEFYLSFVRHTRFLPKTYTFDYNFFWVKLDLKELNQLERKTRIFSRNKFNLLSFYDNDHIHLGRDTLEENIKAYMEENGVTEEITSIELFTNPRILGYTFNPVSFYFIETTVRSYVMIEIGNTFNEQKPYLVFPESKINDEWVYTGKKHFYISPFASVENTMTFKIKRDYKKISIIIDDFNFKNGQLELRASYHGKSLPWTQGNAVKLLLQYPFITFRIIFMIHYHALRLFLKKIPFWKKGDEAHLQKDLFTWKDKAYRR